ncbi:tetratricopeptide repeat protein [Flavobacterium frigidarium]|uniref:tetratricopeptide repeat protein n=1 Tax=Flavobacterium frigidarium TaxID=99286 RepID=UPI0009FBDC9C|nr:tetratricopeptide repeat protein [Flavobacterium frigidarium]
MKKIIAIVLISIFCPKVQAQQDGYWDKDRAITQELIVSAGERVVFKADDFPIGTTELIYRITLLDDNQQLATSLVSLLKAIPDPTGISQGSAGAVFLMSKISGQDKCKYAIFTASDVAATYLKTGKTDQACFVQNTALSKEAKRLSIEKSLCVQGLKNGLYFGFQSSNWIMKQKIVLEIVPWIDSKLNRGWTLENRKTVINQCKTSALARRMADSDDFCICVEEKIQKKFKYQEFQKLLAIEQAKNYKDFGAICFEETGGSKALIDGYRTKASVFEKKADYSNAIAQYNLIINDNKATVADFSAIGFDLIVTKQYVKAIKFLKEGESLDDTDLAIKLNLAHAYLLNNDFRSARNLYKEYFNQNISDTISWVEKTKADFELFKKLGLPSEDFEKILKLMK